jgi:hypothetical protein
MPPRLSDGSRMMSTSDGVSELIAVPTRDPWGAFSSLGGGNLAARDGVGRPPETGRIGTTRVGNFARTRWSEMTGLTVAITHYTLNGHARAIGNGHQGQRRRPGHRRSRAWRRRTAAALLHAVHQTLQPPRRRINQVRHRVGGPAVGHDRLHPARRPAVHPRQRPDQRPVRPVPPTAVRPRQRGVGASRSRGRPGARRS